MRRLVLHVCVVTALLSAALTTASTQGASGERAAQISPSAAGAFTSLPPARILDTRNGTGLAGAFQPNQIRDLTVTGVGGVPPANVDAVVVNVTATQPSASGWLTVFPRNATFPTASNLNFTANQTVANLVLVKVGTAGQVSIANTALPTGPPPGAGTVHVVADVVGYHESSGAGTAGFTGLTSTRVLDTRSGIGLSGAFAANQTRNVFVGAAGAPADADAVVVNVTATQPTAAGFLTLFPVGQPLPLASNLNFVAGQTVPNLAIVKMGTNAQIAIANTAVPSGPQPPAGTVHVVLDVVGFYKAGSGANLTTITPARVLDTRNAPGTPVGPNATITVDPKVNSPLPPVGSYSAVVANITATTPTQSGFLTAFPSDVSLPLASNLNFTAGQTVPNLVELRVGSDGRFKIANTALPSGSQPPSGTAHVVVDVLGYFTGNAGSAPVLPAVPPFVTAPTPAPLAASPTPSILVSGLNRPWDIAFLPGASGPNGALLYTENDARTVSAYINSGTPRRVLLTEAAVDTAGEGGMMGIAVHPNYPTTPWVYLCFTALSGSGNDNRVVRYTLNVDGTGPLSLTSPVPVVTGMLKSTFHNGCRIRFQPGAGPPALFVTMGDAGVGPSPQDPNGLNGKILRVTDTGTAYAGNPSGLRWYTRGHRNPQGIAFRPADNVPWNAEHGPGINDEVNALFVGGNAGWDPNTNGSYDQSLPMTDLSKFPNAIRPKWRSGDSFTIAPSGMTFLQNIGGEDWRSWAGNAVVAVLKDTELRMLVVDGGGNVTGQVTIYDSPVRLRVPVLGPDGKLYLTTDQNPGDIRFFDPA